MPQTEVFYNEEKLKIKSFNLMPGGMGLKIDKSGKKENILKIYQSGRLGWDVLQRAQAQYHSEEMGLDLAHFGLSEIKAL